MTTWVDSFRTARKRHSCAWCPDTIENGELYNRQAGFDSGHVWTTMSCMYCVHVTAAFGRYTGEEYYDPGYVDEWLYDTYPAVWAARQAGWRYPDGERLPYPALFRCFECRTRVTYDRIWCDPCNLARVERLAAQMEVIIGGLHTP